MSVIIIEKGEEGLGIYNPEVETVANGSIHIINRTDYDVKMNDPNNILTLVRGKKNSVNSKIIYAGEQEEYFVRVDEQEGIYDYSMSAKVDEVFGILKGVYGTPRIVIVA